MKLMIAIDGACRRNGKPDCVAAGGVFMQCYDKDNKLVACKTLAAHENNSTNQRGELLALRETLEYIMSLPSGSVEALIITDSEYIFNAMRKTWYINWLGNNWCTRAGDPVKNTDIWMDIAKSIIVCEARGIDITFYHVKGHCIPFGTVTANKILEADQTGAKLLREVHNKFDAVAPTKQKIFDAAFELSERNNGFRPPNDVFREWVTANVVADAIATKRVDEADMQH